jgi:hypothetical protein
MIRASLWILRFLLKRKGTQQMPVWSKQVLLCNHGAHHIAGIFGVICDGADNFG